MEPPVPMDAKELVRACLSGAAGADERLAEAIRPAVEIGVRRALGRLGIRAEPDRVSDLSQDVFVALMERDHAVLRRFRWDCPLDRYLAIVAALCSLRKFRKYDRGRSVDPEILAALTDTSGTSDPLAGLEREEASIRIDRALLRLTAHERLVIQYHYFDGFPVERIARILRIGRSTVRSLLCRSRARLGSLIKRSPMS